MPIVVEIALDSPDHSICFATVELAPSTEIDVEALQREGASCNVAAQSKRLERAECLSVEKRIVTPERRTAQRGWNAGEEAWLPLLVSLDADIFRLDERLERFGYVEMRQEVGGHSVRCPAAN